MCNVTDCYCFLHDPISIFHSNIIILKVIWTNPTNPYVNIYQCTHWFILMVSAFTEMVAQTLKQIFYAGPLHSFRVIAHISTCKICKSHVQFIFFYYSCRCFSGFLLIRATAGSCWLFLSFIFLLDVFQLTTSSRNVGFHLWTSLWFLMLCFSIILVNGLWYFWCFTGLHCVYGR